MQALAVDKFSIDCHMLLWRFGLNNDNSQPRLIMTGRHTHHGRNYAHHSLSQNHTLLWAYYHSSHRNSVSLSEAARPFKVLHLATSTLATCTTERTSVGIQHRKNCAPFEYYILCFFRTRLPSQYDVG